MRKDFVETRNVKKFVTAVQGIIDAPEGVDRMALVYGDPGLGKTEAALWWVNHYGQGAAFVRTKKLMSGRWLLEELVSELGEAPAYRTSDLFRQCVELLIGTDRVVILDEVDYLTHDSRIIETIRDIHDTTNSPFVYLGMDKAEKKLKGYRHLWRRFSQVARFEVLDLDDVRQVLAAILEVQITNEVAQAVYEACEHKPTTAVLYRWGAHIERVARARRLELVDAPDLQAKGRNGA